MRRTVSVSMVAAGLLATVYAQEPGNPPATAKAIIVTGCVIAASPGSFTLTNAMPANSTARPGSTAVGTSGVGYSYDLSARAGLDLSSHVGHKVEITGTPVGNAAGSPGASRVDRESAGASGASTDRASDRPSAGGGRRGRSGLGGRRLAERPAGRRSEAQRHCAQNGVRNLSLNVAYRPAIQARQDACRPWPR
jgi:hypothetical protein